MQVRVTVSSRAVSASPQACPKEQFSVTLLDPFLIDGVAVYRRKLGGSLYYYRGYGDHVAVRQNSSRPQEAPLHSCNSFFPTPPRA